MPSTGWSATASATTGSAITSSASGSTTAGCSGGSLTAGSGSTTGVSSVRAGVSTHSSSCALAGSARCAFRFRPPSRSLRRRLRQTPPGLLSARSAQQGFNRRYLFGNRLLFFYFCSVSVSCACSFCPKPSRKEATFFSFAICDHTPRCLFMAQLHQKLKNDEISWIVYHLT
nr:Uncharacterised protein [Klebsiella pneumoniae]